MTFDLDLGVMSRDATLVVNPCTKFELDTTYCSRVRTITIFHWPPAEIPNFTFLRVKGVKFQISSFLPPKGTTLARTTHNDVLSVVVCVKVRPVAVAKKSKKGQKLSCVKLAICPDHPRRRSPLKFYMHGWVRELVIYFTFHENRLRVLRAVGGRKSRSPIDKAHGLYNSL